MRCESHFLREPSSGQMLWAVFGASHTAYVCLSVGVLGRQVSRKQQYSLLNVKLASVGKDLVTEGCLVLWCSNRRSSLETLM